MDTMQLKMKREEVEKALAIFVKNVERNMKKMSSLGHSGSLWNLL